MPDEQLTRLIHVRLPQGLAERLESKLRMRRTRQPQTTVSSYVRDLIAADLASTRQAASPSASTPKTKAPSRPDLQAELDRMGAEPGRFEVPHLVQSDGTCAGGCDVDLQDTCTVAPDDPRRTGKRRRR